MNEPASRLKRLFFWLIAWIIFIAPIAFGMFKENASIFELNKLVLTRPIILILASALLLSIAANNRITLVKHRFWKFWLASLAILIIGAVFSEVPLLSFLGNSYRHQGVYSLFFYWLLLFLVVWFRPDKKAIDNWLKLVAITAGIVSLYGYIQVIGLDFIVWSGNSSRITSTFGQPNFLGQYLVMAIPLSFYVYHLTKQRVIKLLLALCLALEFFVLFHTSSRAAWLGLIASVIAGLAVYVYVSGKYRKLFVSLFAAMAILLALTAWQAKNIPATPLNYIPGVSRFASSFVTDSGSQVNRLSYWRVAKDEFLATSWRHRLFGYGKDAQEIVFQKRYDKDWGVFEALNSFPDRAHNVAIDAWLEFGLIGLIVFGGLWITIVWQALRVGRDSDQKTKLLIAVLTASLAGYFVAGLFGFPLTAHYLYCAIILGLLVVLGATAEKTYNFNIFKQPVIRNLLIGSSMLSFLAISYTYDFRWFMADHYLLEAQKAEANGSYRGMIDNSEKMLDWFYLNPHYRGRYLYFYNNALAGVTTKESANQATKNILEVVDSFSDVETKIFFNQNQVAHSYSLLMAYDDKAYYEKAVKAYERLIENSPLMTVIYQDYARMQVWAGHFDKALDIYARGLAATPDLDDKRFAIGFGTGVVTQQTYIFYNLICDAYSYKKETDKAIEYCLKAEDLNPGGSQNLESLMNLYSLKKDFNKALGFALQAKASNPREVKWNLITAKIYRDLGNTAKALHYAKIAQKMEPENMDVDKFLAELKAP